MENDGILDFGCGPADILEYLPGSIRYFGFDISAAYIARAAMRYRGRGTFQSGHFQGSDQNVKSHYDIVLMLGVLHHLDDNEAEQILKHCWSALRSGGRLITVDPVFTQDQNPVARFLISYDRGRNVRSESGYVSLIQSIFGDTRSGVRDQKWIPWTHCFTESCKAYKNEHD